MERNKTVSPTIVSRISWSARGPGLRGAQTLGVLAFSMGVAALGASPASAEPSEQRVHYNLGHVNETRDALERADTACSIVTMPMPPLFGLPCGRGMNEMREALDEAHHRRCGLDVYWVDRGPMSYDTEYRFEVCPPSKARRL